VNTHLNSVFLFYVSLEMKVYLHSRFVILTTISILFVQMTFAQAVSFSPARIFFKGNPGETVTEDIILSNSSKDTYEFIANIKDWKRDSLGTKIYFPMNVLPNSNAKNISLEGTSIKLNPGEKKSFTISMLIPKENSNISSNSMLFFTQTNARQATVSGATGIGIKINLELGVQLFYTPPIAKAGEMKFLAFEYENKILDQEKTSRFAVKFENTGDFNKDGVIRFELTNKQTGEETKLPPISMAIMPHDQQWIYCPVPSQLTAGEYLVVAILDTGENNNLKVAEKEINVKR
jgi:hypothetical protein